MRTLGKRVGLAPQQVYSHLVVSYSSVLQQGMRTMAALGKHPNTRQLRRPTATGAAPVVCIQVVKPEPLVERA
jgi:hypothetical protein